MFSLYVGWEAFHPLQVRGGAQSRCIGVPSSPCTWQCYEQPVPQRIMR